MRHDLNLTTDRPTFVTHLECSLTGERYEADRLHGLSAAGKPLLVRYDLDGVRATLTKEALAARPMDLWRWRELLPVRQTRNIVSLGENATPLIPLPRTAKRRVSCRTCGSPSSGNRRVARRTCSRAGCAGCTRWCSWAWASLRTTLTRWSRRSARSSSSEREVGAANHAAAPPTLD